MMRGVRRPTRYGHASFWGTLALPFVFFGWMLGGETTLGNDYVFYPVVGAQNLRFFTEHGIEPMWYPHQAGGFPIGGLFFGQYFHLPAWLTARLPGFWTGDALRWISLRHLLLFALLHGTFSLALRRLAGLSRVEGFLLALVSAYSLRTLDSLRYAIGLEAAVYAQVAALLAAVHVRRPSLALLVGVCVFTQLLLSCGYPVVIPFVLFGALLLALALAGAVGSRAVLVRGAQATAAALLGALLAAPSLVALLEWMSVNETRVARPRLDWAAAWALEPSGLLANLAAPWGAEVHSAFGGSTFLAVWLVTVAAALLRRGRHAWWLLLGLAFPFVYAVGTRTPLFGLLFAHVPGFSSLRVPGRSLIALPLVLLAAVVWLRRRAPAWRPLEGAPARFGLAAGVVLAAAGLASLVAGAASPEYSAATLSDFWTTGHRVFWIGLGLAGALSLRWTARSRVAVAALLGATALQTGLLMRHGTWTGPLEPTPTRQQFHEAGHLPLFGEAPLLARNELGRHSAGTATVPYARFLKAARGRANCALPVHAHDRDRGVLLPFYLTDATVCVGSPEEGLERLGATGGCLREPLTRAWVADPACTDGEAATADGLVRLNEGNRIVALTPNLTTLEVETPGEAVLVTPYVAATRNWEGRIDGRPAPLLSVDGGFLGLRVPPGRHTLSVRYHSQALVLGYRVAAVAALLAAIALAVAATRRHLRLAALLSTLFVALGIPSYLAWERSFIARARVETVLNHRYPELLREQLARWSAPP